MRNHASAAHPNHIELTGLQLANWLDTCIRQVITIPQDAITANTGRLLKNIKSIRLDPDQIATTAAFFEELPGDRADTLATGLFGLYVDPKRPSVVADNVRQLWPELWEYTSDDSRYSFGVRYGRYLASSDHGHATAARELLDLVDGAMYLPEQIRVVEIDKSVDALLSAHVGWDNFYNEVEPAKALDALLGQEAIPEPIAGKVVDALVRVFLGNGFGTARDALPSYKRMLEALGPNEAGRALRSFKNPTISSVLGTSAGRRQWEMLLDLLEPKLTRRTDRELYDAVRAFNGTPDQLHTDSGIKRMIEPRHLSKTRNPRQR